MRQIKIQRLRSMNCFSKTRREFAHDNFIEKTGHKQNATDHPEEKNSERRNPRPPARPRRERLALVPPTLKHANPRKYKRINNRSLDQHRDREQRKDVN